MKQRTRPADEALLTWRPTGTRPRSVYIHIPFCRHRCGYCNFSLVADRDYLVDRFLAAIETEINWLDDTYDIDTLFLGGGTPSHLSPKNLERLLSIVQSRFRLDDAAEVTAECNPNDLQPAKAAALASFGVNRISLGVQSLNPGKLKTLERDHNVRDVEMAVENARRFAGNVSLDLIFATPGETSAEWRQDVQSALALNPDHVSTYELTYEKGTQFWNRRLHGELQESDEDLRADMYLAAMELMEQAELAAYEISSFARPGLECLHNESYWTGRPYFAFGPGASRYVDGTRETNHQSTTRYLQLVESGQSPVAFSEKLSAEASARELLSIGLRRVVGLQETAFEQLTQFRIGDLLGDAKEDWLDHGLIETQHGNWRLTHRGRLVADRIATEIVGRV